MQVRFFYYAVLRPQNLYIVPEHHEKQTWSILPINSQSQVRSCQTVYVIKANWVVSKKWGQIWVAS
jgi:hypothetical protein